MGNDPWAILMAILLWFALIAYGVFAGADFGAGFWGIFGGGHAASDERGAVIAAIGPVWEANNIWLIFLITGVFTAFPIVFSTLSVALLIPLIIALLGVVLRGAGFAYYSHFRETVAVNLVWGRIFSGASVIAPFFFGAAAGAIASGNIRVQGNHILAGYWSSWLTPFCLLCGAFGLGLSAVVAAVFLCVEAQGKSNRSLLDRTRKQGLAAYIAVAVIGVLAAWRASAEATYLWQHLLSGWALVLVIGTLLLGLASAGALLLRRFVLARILIVGTTIGVFAAWALAQAPYLIVPDITIASAAAEPGVEVVVFWCSILGLAIVLPSFIYLLYMFKSDRPQPRVTAADMLKMPGTSATANVSTLVASEGASPIQRTAQVVRGVSVTALLSLAMYALVRLWRDLRHVRHRDET